MSKEKKIKIILSIVGISFLQGLQFSVSPVLNQISEHYPDISVSLIQMLITAPALLSVVVALISGWLVVKISKKKLLIAAGLAAGILGLMPLMADSFWLLFITRLLYGASLGLATALNTAVVADFFEGDERVSVMGIQAASVGAGMVVVTTVGGMLGSGGFTRSYLINLVAFISTALIAFCLPDTGKVQVKKSEKITLTRRVFGVSVIGFLEYFFLITFTTNIAMHLSGSLAGDSAVSGTLTGIFSGAQIVVGLILGVISKLAKKYTLPVAMLSFSLGGVLLILFPSNYVMLMIGSILCGFSQGTFIPTAMVEVSNAVKASSVAMASAVLTCFMNFGQLVSPVLLNGVAKLTLGEASTSNVYLVAVIGMAIAAAGAAVYQSRS